MVYETGEREEQLRPNPMREGIARGEVQIGAWIDMVHNPAILRLMQASGLDFARMDLEHAMPSTETVAGFAMLARALGFGLAVRPPSNDREWIQRLLDAGIWNLHCAGVAGARDAENIVSVARYRPLGDRGMSNRAAATEYERRPDAEHMAFANAQVHVTVMLETAAALDEIDDIAAMEGIDALTLGPADLAQDLGIVGTPDEARIIDEKREVIFAAAARHKKTAAMLARSADEVRRWREAGAMIIAYKSDTAVLMEGYARIAELKAP